MICRHKTCILGLLWQPQNCKARIYRQYIQRWWPCMAGYKGQYMERYMRAVGRRVYTIAYSVYEGRFSPTKGFVWHARALFNGVSASRAGSVRPLHFLSTKQHRWWHAGAGCCCCCCCSCCCARIWRWQWTDVTWQAAAGSCWTSNSAPLSSDLISIQSGMSPLKTDGPMQSVTVVPRRLSLHPGADPARGSRADHRQLCLCGLSLTPPSFVGHPPISSGQ